MIDSKNFITVFTATYNRGYILSQLYTSLLKQNYKNFEWLIVDDGSTDNTETLIHEWKIRNKIEIKYIKQPNYGKHIAMNRAVKEAKGDIFFIIDSDDYLTNDSLTCIINEWKYIENDNSIVGVVGRKCSTDGHIIGGGMKQSYLTCSIFEKDFRYKIKGDGAEALKTSVLATFPFPNIDGEKFCAESLVWNRMGQKFKFLYFNKPVNVINYLESGLSANSIRNRIKNPTYACMIYSELVNNTKVPVIYKIKAIINYWRFSFYRNIPFREKLHEIGIAKSILFIPIAYLYKIKDTLNSNVKLPI